MDKERLKNIRKYQQLYSRAENVDLGICVYCGDLRECLDHVPPLKHLDHMDIDKYQQQAGKFILYPSCLSCNSLLGSKKLFSLIDRLDYLYRKYLHMAEVCKWTDEELEQLGRGLKGMILSHEAKRQEYNHKLRGVEQNLVNFNVSDY